MGEADDALIPIADHPVAGADQDVRQTVAIDPMTAPADAFDSGVGVRRLAPT